MKIVDATEAQARLDEVLEEAQSQPIVIRRDGQDRAVVLSITEYESLRMGAVRAFLELRNEVAREAGIAGLTERRLNELLDKD